MARGPGLRGASFLSMTRSIALVLSLLLVPAALAAGTAQLTYENGQLSAQLHQAEVDDVLLQVAQKARLEIRGRPLHKEPLNLELRRVSLHKGLTRILDGQNFFVFYADGRPVRVVLLGSGGTNEVLAEGPPADTPDPIGEVRVDEASVDEGRLDEASVDADSATAAEAQGEASDPVAAADASQRRVPIDPALARAIGADSTSFSDITAVAVRDPNPAVRADALRVGLDILESEPDLSKSFLQVLEQRDDAALADWLTRVAGDRALELARLTASESRNDTLRQRAAAVQRRLEANARAGGS